MNETLCQNIRAARRLAREIKGNSRHCKFLSLLKMNTCGFPRSSLAGKYELCQ